MQKVILVVPNYFGSQSYIMTMSCAAECVFVVNFFLVPFPHLILTTGCLEKRRKTNPMLVLLLFDELGCVPALILTTEYCLFHVSLISLSAKEKFLFTMKSDSDIKFSWEQLWQVNLETHGSSLMQGVPISSTNASEHTGWARTFSESPTTRVSVPTAQTRQPSVAQQHETLQATIFTAAKRCMFSVHWTKVCRGESEKIKWLKLLSIVSVQQSSIGSFPLQDQRCKAKELGYQ